MPMRAILAAASLALLVSATAASAQSKPQAGGTRPDPLAARAKGSPTAPVTVYEFSDFQCPYCRRHALETFPELERLYVRTGKVRWVFINFPLTQLHPNAAAAAAFAMCAAKAGKFWPVHDLLFKYQQVWAPLREPGPFLLSLADSAHVARAEVAPCLESREGEREVAHDAQGAARAGAASTPSFIIEGGLMAGAAPVAVFRSVLDSVLATKAAH